MYISMVVSENLRKNSLWYEIEVIAGDQIVVDSVKGSLNTVMETHFAMAMGINDRFRTVFFGDPGKR